MKKLYSLIIVAIMLVGCLQSMSAQTVTSLQIAVSTKPTTPVTEGKLAVGGNRTYSVIVEPASAASLPVSWSVSDKSIATIDAATGKTRGMGAGVTTITAEVGGVKANYTLTVAQKAAKVGDIYYDNNSWEAAGFVTGKKCIGIVFYVNEDGMSGKIASLDEATRLKWSLAASAQPGATSAADGMTNLDAIKSQSGWQDSFEAEKWCAAKTDANLQWYLPAIDELRQLYAATCGLKWTAPGDPANNAAINPAWTDMLQTMLPGDNTNPYPEARAAFNTYITKVNGTPFNADGTTRYWSSTEYASDFALLLSFEGGYSQAQPRQYDHIGNTRAIAAFPNKQGTSGITGINNTPAGNTGATITVNAGQANVATGVKLASVQVYTITGTLTGATYVIDGTTAAIDIAQLTTGTYIVVANGTDGSRHTAKLIKR